MTSIDCSHSWQWPIDELWLRRNGWTVPDGDKSTDNPNWRHEAFEPAECAQMLVDGLGFGREAPDPT